MGCKQGHTPHAAISDPKSPGAAGSLPVSAQHPDSSQGLALKEAPAPPRGVTPVPWGQSTEPTPVLPALVPAAQRSFLQLPWL